MTELGKGKQRHFFPPGETPTGEKACSKCNRVLPVSAFYWQKPFWRSDGLVVQSYCKECMRERIRRLNREKPERVMRERRVRWQAIRSDPVLHAAQLESVRVANKKRLESDPEFRAKMVLNTRNRRARLAGAEGVLSVGEWRGVVAAYCSSCLCCLRSGVAMSVDHCQLVQHGGANDVGNVEPLCRACNGAWNHASHDFRKGVSALVFQEVFSPRFGRCWHVPGLEAPAACAALAAF